VIVIVYKNLLFDLMINRKNEEFPNSKNAITGTGIVWTG
jgi:hypothetical protein